MNTSTVRVGIIGAGRIAAKMAHTLQQMNTAEAVAVASRSAEKAETFARQHGVTRAYGSYEALLEDKNVDLVYIATTNNRHYEQLKLSLEYGKHVLGEKPFTMTAAEAREIFALARSRNLYAAEAVWMCYMPFWQTIFAQIRSGRIGTVRSLSATFGNRVIDRERIWSPELGGGALRDLGVYTLHFAAMVLGMDSIEISSMLDMDTSGVDGQAAINIRYAQAMATLFASVRTATERAGTIHGDDGFIHIANLTNPETALLCDSTGRVVEQFARPQQITGFEYQVKAAADSIHSGQHEPVLLPHRQTMHVLETIDEILARPASSPRPD